MYRFYSVLDKKSFLDSAKFVSNSGWFSGIIDVSLKKDIFFVRYKQIGSTWLCGVCNYQYGLMDWYLIPTSYFRKKKLKYLKTVNFCNWRGGYEGEKIFQNLSSSTKTVKLLEQELNKYENEIDRIKWKAQSVITTMNREKELSDFIKNAK